MDISRSKGGDVRETNVRSEVAVIGGGASGTLVASHLLRRARGGRIALIERRAEIGCGVAYSTRSPEHLLNVPAGNMSALPEDLSHFVRWLRGGHMPEANEKTFAPRFLFARYLQKVLEEAERASGAELVRLRGEATGVDVGSGWVRVRLGDRREVRARRAVLALGNFPPRRLPFAPHDPRHVPDAWEDGALDGIPDEAPILLVGTSLTAIDVAMSLRARGHTGRIYAVSRRGLVPNPYADRVSSPPYPPFLSPADSHDLTGLIRKVRSEVRRATGLGTDWHPVIEAIRPLAQRLWESMPVNERRRFLRHLQPYWEVHRHRVAPQVGEVVRRMRRSGEFVVIAGRIRRLRKVPGGVEIEITLRGGGKWVLRAFCTVNCTAPEMDLRRVGHPLIAGLLRDGRARPGPLGIGLETDGEGALVEADGSVSRILYTLGPLRKGDLWETIAIPEIREQAARLAAELLRTERGVTSGLRDVPYADLLESGGGS
ncbi:FAD/NAD(P)-binding protein [Rubrobacter calidifluminis]|uniref:FAD/NAD(P)-binding protein n=1 Tax=Rubrobacter calidifluminis TaxID=1392640 RepID=UPI002362E5EC|nr:FAD/NAD(P)-binding protein [Rubrobacter calidifluminis]